MVHSMSSTMESHFQHWLGYCCMMRLIVLCLLINKGVQSAIQDFSDPCRLENDEAENLKPDSLAFLSSVAQLIASIPDKARPKSTNALSSHSFFKHISVQYVAGARERSITLFSELIFQRMKAVFCLLETCSHAFVVVEQMDFISSFSFLLGSVKGHKKVLILDFADILVTEMVFQIHLSVKDFLSSDSENLISETIVSSFESQFWPRIIKAIKDTYVVERFSEGILHKLAAENGTGVEAYWCIWLLYNPIVYNVPLWSIFVDKFILCKVFPICCLRWILQSFVLECPPQHTLTDDQNRVHLLDTIQLLAGIWSKQKFVQSATIEQQACILLIVLQRETFAEYHMLDTC